MGSIDRFIPQGSVELARSLHAPPRQRPWGPGDVGALLDGLYPPPGTRPGDRSPLRQQLSSAFLAGVAESQDALMLRPRGSLVADSIATARTLLKNRAARQDDRLWHAFMAGERAGRATAGFEVPAQDAGLKLFIRQPLTESGLGQQALIASVLDRIERHNGTPHAFRYLTGHQAESADTFRASFEAESGQPFTPQAFRAWRLARLAQADAFVNIRVGMSESSAFELSYHVFSGACTPVLFLVWKHAPIKTTLLKDLQNLCDVTYLEFEDADDLDAGLGDFFGRCKRQRVAA
ncbi:MAG TPA: hypothetical protein VF169_00120 [Albitalea sp.]|uniref:hypothetical protein n=1 Tax=Piscinibacter sp. TaxID=1903157 RepID=UPI002ED174D1